MNFFIPLNIKLTLYTLLLIIISTITMALVTDRYINDFFKKSIKAELREVFYDVSKSFKTLETNLAKNIHFISKNESIIASLNLIKNYEDKNNYDSIIFDEEKKKIVNVLLSEGQYATQGHVSVYDTKYNLVAFIDVEDQDYIQGYVSYDKGEKVYYTKRVSSSMPYKLSPEPKHFDSDISKTKKLATNTIQTSDVVYKALDGMLNMGVIYKAVGDMLNMRVNQPILRVYKDNRVDTIGYIETNNNISVNRINRENNKGRYWINYYFSDTEEFNSEIKKFKKTPLLFSQFGLNDISLEEDDSLFFLSVKSALENGSMLMTAQINKSESSAFLDENRKKLTLIVLFIILITMVISLLMLNKLISNPIRRLTKGIKVIAKGEYAHKIDIKQNDELGSISNSFNEMAEQISKREKDLDALAHQDVLTKIPNRFLFNQRLEEAVSRASRVNKKIAVLFIDLDEFKIINDTLGHNFGDELLIKVATNLVKVMRKSDLLARIGGDEFNVLIEDLDSVIFAEEIAQKLLTQLSLPIEIDNMKINVTGSIGISIYPLDAKDSGSLLKNADLAMYDAKNSGRNRYKFFSEELSITLKNRSQMLGELKNALIKDEFELYYQPKFSLIDGSIYAAEALIRWKSKKLGFVSPDQFISLAEESGEIVKIGAWVIKQAARDFASWKDLGLNIRQVSVNVSNVQFEKDDVVKILSDAIEENNIDSKSLEVEITESYIHEDSDTALTILNNIRELGVDLAMDDFGTGYSSMSYLKRLPLTRLKIDKSFIDDIPHDSDDVEITKIIVALAKVMNLSITAEGIETIEQMHFLKNLGCDEGQGYVCSKPLPYDQFVSVLKNKTNCTAATL